MYVAKPIEWTDEGVVMLDQRLLPTEEVSYTFTTYQDVAKAIKDMVIRGAPAIGVAAAMGVAIGVQKSCAKSLQVQRISGNPRRSGQDSARGRSFWALIA
jgi:methylthioribose-1-phosphate isomerase